MPDIYLNNMSTMANYAKSSFQVGMIKKVIETSPILNMFPGRAIGKLVHKFTTEEKLPEMQSRNLGVEYASEKTNQIGKGEIDLAVFGGKFSTDRLQEDEEGYDGMSVVQNKVQAFNNALPLDLKRKLFKGSKNSGSAAEFNGLEKSLTRDSQIQDFAGASSGVTITAADLEDITGSIDEAISSCITLPSVIATSRTVINSLRKKCITVSNDPAARKFEFRNYQLPGIEPGKFIEVRTAVYDGVFPMIAVDDDSQGNEILGFNETLGGIANTQSMWFICGKNDIFEFLTKYADGPRIFTRPGEAGPVVSIDWPLVFWLKNQKGAVRLGKIKAG